MTADETDSRTDGSASAIDDPGVTGSDGTDADATDSDATGSESMDPDETDSNPDSADIDATDADPADRIEALEATVQALAEQVSQLERNLAWIARQQARETGNGVCPKCDTGGGLRVERTPTARSASDARGAASSSTRGRRSRRRRPPSP